MFHLVWKFRNYEVSTVNLDESMANPIGRMYRLIDKIVLDAVMGVRSDQHYETIVFGEDGRVIEVQRYNTEAEAREGHEAQVAKWKRLIIQPKN